MTDYSQSGEQAAILRACGDVSGNFLDIGAFCATSLSNTRALYEKGWSGVLVEPSPGPLKGLIQEYGNDPRIKVIAGAVGVDRHMVEFHVSDDAVTTNHHDNFKKWEKAGGFYGSFWVPMITLHEILHQFGSFDFVNIDTEGTSLQLFKVLMQTEMKPRCVCMEYDGNLMLAKEIAYASGYHLVDFTGENAIFAIGPR